MRAKLVFALRQIPGWSTIRTLTSAIYLVAARFFGWLIGAPIVALLFLIEPFFKVRFCHIGAVTRIGWLAVSPDYYLRLWRREGMPPDSHFIFVMHSPDNRPFMEMYKRVLSVWESRIADTLLGIAAPVLGKTRFVLSDHSKYHNSRFYSDDAVFLHLTAEEERRGKDFLRSLGIGENDWFVPFHAREPQYYENIRVSTYTQSVHAYRDCSPENYLSAAKLISDRGGFAIRMGAGKIPALKTPLPARVIDYAVNQRDEFADIYLCAKAKFFLGNSAGLVCVPTIFGVRNAVANYIPYSSTPLNRNDVWIPKLIRHTPSGQLLTFKEAETLGFFALGLTSEALCEVLDREKLVCEENSPEDIADLCRDMLDAFDGNHPAAQARDLQLFFRDQYESHLQDKEFLPLISGRFAKKYEKLIRP